MKKGSIILSLFLLLLVIPFVSAGLDTNYDWTITNDTELKVYNSSDFVNFTGTITALTTNSSEVNIKSNTNISEGSFDISMNFVMDNTTSSFGADDSFDFGVFISQDYSLAIYNLGCYITLNKDGTAMLQLEVYNDTDSNPDGVEEEIAVNGDGSEIDAEWFNFTYDVSTGVVNCSILEANGGLFYVNGTVPGSFDLADQYSIQIASEFYEDASGEDVKGPVYVDFADLTILSESSDWGLDPDFGWNFYNGTYLKVTNTSTSVTVNGTLLTETLTEDNVQIAMVGNITTFGDFDLTFAIEFENHSSTMTSGDYQVFAIEVSPYSGDDLFGISCGLSIDSNGQSVFSLGIENETEGAGGSVSESTFMTGDGSTIMSDAWNLTYDESTGVVNCSIIEDTTGLVYLNGTVPEGFDLSDNYSFSFYPEMYDVNEAPNNASGLMTVYFNNVNFTGVDVEAESSICGGEYSGSGDWIINSTVSCADEEITVDGDIVVRNDGDLSVTSFSDYEAGAYDLSGNASTIDSAIPDLIKDESEYTENWDPRAGSSFYMIMNESEHKLKIYASTTNVFAFDLDNDLDTGDNDTDEGFWGADLIFGYDPDSEGDLIGCWDNTTTFSHIGFFTPTNDSNSGSNTSCTSSFTDSAFDFNVYWNKSDAHTWEIVIDLSDVWEDKYVFSYGGDDDYITTFKNGALVSAMGNLTFDNITLDYSGDFNVSGSAYLNIYDSYLEAQLTNNVSAYLHLEEESFVEILGTNLTNNDSVLYFGFQISTNNFTISNNAISRPGYQGYSEPTPGVYIDTSSGGESIALFFNNSIESCLANYCMALSHSETYGINISSNNFPGTLITGGFGDGYATIEYNVFIEGGSLDLRGDYYNVTGNSFLEGGTISLGQETPEGNILKNNDLTSSGTNLNDENSSYGNTLIHSNNYGQITWFNKSNLTIFSRLSLEEEIFLEDNLIGLYDSVALTQLNTTTELEFYNLGYGGAAEFCEGGPGYDSNCQTCDASINCSYDSGTGTMLVNVTHFSNYTTAGETTLAAFTLDFSTSDISDYENVSDDGEYFAISAETLVINKALIASDASVAGLVTLGTLDYDNFSTRVEFVLQNDSVIDSDGNYFIALQMVEDTLDDGISCMLARLNDGSGYLSIYNRTNYSDGGGQQATTTTASGISFLESDADWRGNLSMSYDNSTQNITCSAVIAGGDGPSITASAGALIGEGYALGLLTGFYDNGGEITSTYTTTFDNWQYTTEFTDFSSEDEGGDDEGGDSMGNFWDGFLYGLNWDFYSNETSNDNFISNVSGMLLLNSSSEDVSDFNGTYYYTQSNVTNNSFISSVWMNLTDTSSTLGTAASIGGSFPYISAGFRVDVFAGNPNFECMIGYGNLTGYPTLGPYILLVNLSGVQVLSPVNQTVGTLNLEYNSSSESYDCSFGNESQSALAGTINDNMSLSLLTSSADANASAYFDNLSYQVYVEQLENSNESFIEDFADDLDLDFFNADEIGGGSPTTDLDIGLSSDERLELNLTYVSGTNYSSRENGEKILVDYQLSDKSFNTSVGINYTRLTSLIDGNEISQGLKLEGGDGDDYVICQVASFNQTSNVGLEGDYLVMYHITPDWTISVVNASLSEAGDLVEGTLSLGYNNETENLTCHFGSDQISLVGHYPKSYGYPGLGITANLILNATSSGTAEMFFDDWQFNFTSNSEEESNYLEAFTDDFSSLDTDRWAVINGSDIKQSLDGAGKWRANGSVSEAGGIDAAILRTAKNLSGESFTASVLVNLTNTTSTMAENDSALIIFGSMDSEGGVDAACFLYYNLSRSLILSASGDNPEFEVSLGEDTLTMNYNSSNNVTTCYYGSESSSTDSAPINNTFTLGFMSVVMNDEGGATAGDFLAYFDDVNFTYGIYTPSEDEEGGEDFLFNGTVYGEDGTALNNTWINVTVIQTNPSFEIIGYNSTTTNESGWFNLNITENNQWMYYPVITHRDDEGEVDYVGQSLPYFPSEMMQEFAGIDFYLREAGTLNLTAVNSTGDRIDFHYQVKDTKLGFPVAENWDGEGESENLVYLQKGRNYSILIYPPASMPVIFEWDNFSADEDYTFDGGISSYNSTTSTLHKQFNTTMGFSRVHGYVKYDGAETSDWDNLTVISYILESGNMVHEEQGMVPYNLSAFFDQGDDSDLYTEADGFFNITLPSTVEDSGLLLFAVAENSTGFYGGFVNISLDYDTYPDGQNLQQNFTLYPLLGSAATTELENVDEGSYVVTLLKQDIGLVNSSGYVDNVQSHFEVAMDYSDCGATEFTWMADIGQDSSSSVLQLPMINCTGIEEINVYPNGGQYSPRRADYSLTEIQEAINITLSSFNPGKLEEGQGDLSENKIGVEIAMYKSNSTCDVPNPDDSCGLGGGEEEFENFDPMKVTMGGGTISFRMGMLDSGIIIHYVNVDMLASGPPDAAFDSMADESAASEGFESAMRFGSSGPTLYDYVLVSIPYTEGTSSASGLDESGDVDLAIPIFYDDDWNVIWDTSDNGSDASNLAGNYSHYSERESEWDILMSDTTCVTDVDEFNVTNPCYIDTSEDRIWIRLPHFSGTEPAVSGDAVVATGGSSPGGSGGGSGGDRRLDSLEQEEVEDELVVVDEILDGEKIDSEVSTVQEEVKPLDRPIALRWVFAIMLGTILVFIIIIWILKAK